MNPSELRIGNLVDFEGQIETVYQIRHSGVDFFRGTTKKGIVIQSYVWEAVKPITLTEDWLLEFGFKDINNKSFRLFKHANHDIILRIFDGGAISYCEKNEYVLVKSVHHLQNLYYALTQKEL
jgi:hypothetical protein